MSVEKRRNCWVWRGQTSQSPPGDSLTVFTWSSYHQSSLPTCSPHWRPAHTFERWRAWISCVRHKCLCCAGKGSRVFGCTCMQLQTVSKHLWEWLIYCTKVSIHNTYCLEQPLYLICTMFSEFLIATASSDSFSLRCTYWRKQENWGTGVRLLTSCPNLVV
jgi:hypothetical protein